MSTVIWPDHLLTLAEWDAMPEDRLHRYELVEGVPQVTARPTGDHQLAMVRLTHEFDRQLPKDLVAVPDVEVVINASFPPTVRAPDIIIVPTAVFEQKPTRYGAADLLLAVEIVSPGSGVVDRTHKFGEYADAGIPRYWIVDLDPPVSLSGYLLVDGHYERDIETSGILEITSPAGVRIDLDTLVGR